MLMGKIDKQRLLREAENLGVTTEIASELLNDARLSVIRAPAGAGKTVTASIISYLLALEGKRIAFFMRTHAEIEHVLRVLRGVISDMESDVLIIPLFGKSKMCMFVPEDKSVLKWWCIISQCFFLNKRKDEELVDFLRGRVLASKEEYYEVAKSRNLCPYHFYIELSREANIVITTHNYFVDDELFEKLGSLDLAIFDEAHSLSTPPMKEMSKVEYSLAEKILSRFKGEREDRIAKDLWEKQETSVVSVLVKYSEFRDFEGKRIIIDDKIIKVKQIKTLLEERFKDVKKIVLMSATLYPEKFYKKLFEIQSFDGKFKIVKGLIVSGNRELVVLKTGLTTSYRNRGPKLIKALSQILNNLRRSLNEPILVFTPSKQFALDVSNNLGLYVEGRDLSELKNICSKLREGNNILVTYARSPISEGIELTLGPCEPSIAVVLGLPYPKLDSRDRKILSLLASAMGVDKDKFFEAYLLSNMLSTLIQCLGRVGRRRRGVGIIVDDRILNLNIPKLKVFHSVKNLTRFVKSFLEGEEDKGG